MEPHLGKWFGSKRGPHFRCTRKALEAIHKERPAKTRISRPPSPLRPDKTIESHSINN